MEQVNAPAGGHDMSIYGLVSQADIVGKSVIFILVIASIICWAIILEKVIRLWLLGRSVKKLEEAADYGEVTSEPGRGLVGRITEAAGIEAQDGASSDEDRSSLRARIERAMRNAMRAEIQRCEIGLPFLATIGSAGPFIGLFGTVWGIMNSFTAIATQKDTSLAVVAPGIAEALFATALGLGAAIPAVMAYNAIAVSLGRTSGRANTAIANLARSLSRPQQEPHRRAQVEPIRAGMS